MNLMREEPREDGLATSTAIVLVVDDERRSLESPRRVLSIECSPSRNTAMRRISLRSSRIFPGQGERCIKCKVFGSKPGMRRVDNKDRAGSGPPPHSIGRRRALQGAIAAGAVATDESRR
jgi:hypothetical protein